MTMTMDVHYGTEEVHGAIDFKAIDRINDYYAQMKKKRRHIPSKKWIHTCVGASAAVSYQYTLSLARVSSFF